jgi:hypothetical protein
LSFANALFSWFLAKVKDLSTRLYNLGLKNVVSVNSSPTALISGLLAKTSSDDQSTFMNLSYVNFPEHLKPEKSPDEVALAIFQTNAVAAGDGVGIFPRMARLNHGCSSAFNVVYSWREKEGVLVVYALKSIRKGEV